jgi:hypothetical protein
MSTLNWAELIKSAGDVTSNYEALPDGEYELTVVEATAKVTASGKTMFSIKTQVNGGPHNNRLVWDNLVISPENQKALGIFFSKMNALGIPQDYFMRVPAPTNGEIEQVLMARKFRGTVGSRVYNGSKRNEIIRYHSLGQTADAQQASPVGATQPPVAPPPPPPAAPQAPVAPF